MCEASEAKVRLAAVNPNPSARDLLRIVIVGHVDHGKSTLVGRMFHDTGSLPDGKYESIKAMCERRGVPFEWAFLMDALQAERDQGITIDTSQIWFKTDARDYTIIDAPGHKEFLKNMITGAAQSDAALLIIDAAEGVREQSRRHGYLLHLLGIRQVAVAVNKMDLINYEKDQFDLIEQEYRDYLTSIGVTPTFVIPVSARQGDNIVNQTNAMPWYKGPTVVKALDSFVPTASPVDRPLRFPVQDVYKFDHRRIIAGRIEEGSLKVGDTLLFSPSNKSARVQSIEYWSTVPGKKPPMEASAGESIGITLDEQIFVERGELVSHAEHAPIETDVFRARIFWLGHEPMVKGKSYRIKLGTLEAPVTVQSIESIIDTSDLSNTSSHQVERNQVAEIVLRARRMLALDEFISAPKRPLRADRQIRHRGGGIISMEGYADQRDLITARSTNITRVEHGIDETGPRLPQRSQGGVLWFTGLSGAGKSTLAVHWKRSSSRRV